MALIEIDGLGELKSMVIFHGYVKSPEGTLELQVHAKDLVGYISSWAGRASG